jgi:hypothetical protein
MAIFLFAKSIACDRESANRLESMNAASEPLHESMLCNGTNLSLPRAQPKGAVNGAKSTRTLAPEEMLFEQLDLCRASLEGRSTEIFLASGILPFFPNSSVLIHRTLGNSRGKGRLTPPPIGKAKKGNK